MTPYKATRPMHFFFFSFRTLSHFYVGSVFLKRDASIELGRSSPDNSLSGKSFLMFLNHRRFGLPLLLSHALPSPSLSCPHIHLLFSIHAHTTSTYFPALSWIFLPPSFSLQFFHSLFSPAWCLHSSILTFSFPPHPYSYLALSPLPMYPQRTSLLVLHDVLYTSHWPRYHYLVTQNTRYPGCNLCVISASKSPFSANVAPRYSHVFTLSKCSPCRLISAFPYMFPSPLNLRYLWGPTVFFLLIFRPQSSTALIRSSSLLSSSSLPVLHNTNFVRYIHILYWLVDCFAKYGH